MDPQIIFLNGESENEELRYLWLATLIPLGVGLLHFEKRCSKLKQSTETVGSRFETRTYHIRMAFKGSLKYLTSSAFSF
jgi:hypothetical protein